MYNVFVNILGDCFIIPRGQSYDYFTKAVSLTYGKCTNKTELKTAGNQLITKNKASYPMEK